jgi:PadR family transcriptional regulator PadR
MLSETEVLRGTLDLLVLKAVSLGSLHGYGLLARIEKLSGHIFHVTEGAVYPILKRLVSRKELNASWGVSENRRKAKYYTLTRQGNQRLLAETKKWRRLAETTSRFLLSKST